MPAAPHLARATHRRQAEQSDLRWLLAWIVAFGVACLLLLGAHRVYRLTGPHPEVTAVVRWMKHQARWMIPGMKSRPNLRSAGD